MDQITVTGFRWAPPFAQGLVRDQRVRWARLASQAHRGRDVERSFVLLTDAWSSWSFNQTHLVLGR